MQHASYHKVSTAIIVLLLLKFSTIVISCTEHQPTEKRTGRVDSAHWPKTFGFGKKASDSDIAALDIDIRPDGKGLPVGEGTVAEGKIIYIAKCAACHGAGGKGVEGTAIPALVSDTVFEKRTSNTIGNYWPYATTIFDYVRRSMPYNAPGSLTNQEVYALTAFLLSANGIIREDVTLTADNLPKVVMPAKKYFVTDDRHGGREVK